MVIEQQECLKCGRVYDECNCKDKERRCKGVRKDFEGKETTLDGGFESYGASSEAERIIMVGSNARKRESARLRKSVQNELDRVLNRNGKE